MMQINVLGDAFCDVVVHGLQNIPTFGNGELCDGVLLSPGGSAFNTAIHLANLHSTQTKVTLFSALGANTESNWGSKILRKHLHAFNVNFACTEIANCSTGVCVVLSGRGDRAFLTSPGAVSQYSLQHIDIVRLANCHHLHVGGVYCLNALLPDLGMLLTKVRELNPKITISLDTNCDSKDGTWGSPWMGNEILTLVDFVKMNQDEALGVCRAAGGEGCPTSWLATKVLQCAVVTRGELGCEFALHGSPHNITKVDPLRVDTVVDSVGAGDAFNAGLIFKLKQNDPKEFRKAIEFASACGALMVTRLGACQFPVDLDSVMGMLNLG